ncbi:hypothetical protein H8958_008039 [Nasalis larvatus]
MNQHLTILDRGSPCFKTTAGSDCFSTLHATGSDTFLKRVQVQVSSHSDEVGLACLQGLDSDVCHLLHGLSHSVYVGPPGSEAATACSSVSHNALGRGFLRNPSLPRDASEPPRREEKRRSSSQFSKALWLFVVLSVALDLPLAELAASCFICLFNHPASPLTKENLYPSDELKTKVPLPAPICSNSQDWYSIKWAMRSASPQTDLLSWEILYVVNVQRCYSVTLMLPLESMTPDLALTAQLELGHQPVPPPCSSLRISNHTATCCQQALILMNTAYDGLSLTSGSKFLHEMEAQMFLSLPAHICHFRVSLKLKSPVLQGKEFRGSAG